jgi:pimeloyl-ACP methyl ester carboxylesterase
MQKHPSSVQTSCLDMAYEERGEPQGPPVLLLHGWPDDARTWDGVVETLGHHGCRIITPYLRGCGPTRFRDASIMRSGQLAALGQDVVEFLEALALEDLVLVGHDWGARAAYIAAALRPERLRGLVTLAVGYGTNDPGQPLSYPQTRLYWYHWFFATERGRAALETDRRALCRFLWETWSPGWQFSPEEFETTASSWDNPDWVAVTAHSYRHRWGNAVGDLRYRDLEARLAQLPVIRVPTSMLHGAEDGVTLPETSAGKEGCFAAGYERQVKPGVGHFIQRENPAIVVEAILRRTRG